MTETPVSRLILNLGIPTTISMLITSIYNMADTYFVGTLGESAQAATGILFTVQAIMQGLAFMLGHGAGTYVSRALADKNPDEATMYVSTSFFTGIGLGAIISVSGLSFLRPLVHFLGSTDTIAPYAMDYGFWVFLAAPMIICSLILNNCLRYEGKAFYAMFGLTAGGLLNILGDYRLDMPIILDWEIPASDARTANMDARTLTDIQLYFCEKMKGLGYQPMVYFNWHQSENLYYLSELEDFPFWLALYQDRMRYPWKVEMWQYTCTGRVPGINGDVDINVYMP